MDARILSSGAIPKKRMREDDSHYIVSQFWHCCSCPWGSLMSIAQVVACTECGRYRCDDCPIEVVKVSKRREAACSRKSASTTTPAPKKVTAAGLKPRSVDRREAKILTSTFEEEQIPSQTVLDAGIFLVNPDDIITLPDGPQGEDKHDTGSAWVEAAKTVPKRNFDDDIPTALDCSQRLNDRRSKPRTTHEAVDKTFACPFNKLDPSTYDPRIDKRYHKCLKPSVPIYELRRMKDHLLRVHGPLYCDTCSAPFAKEAGLSEHIKESKSCSKIMKLNQFLDDGISHSQWEKISSSLKEKGGLKGADKEEHEKVGWSNMWDALFPGVPQPLTPWVEMPYMSGMSLGSSHSLIAIFHQITAYKVQQGLLVQDYNTVQIYEATLRESFQKFLEQSPGLSQCDQSDASFASAALYQAEEISFDELEATIPWETFWNLNDIQQKSFITADRTQFNAKMQETHFDGVFLQENANFPVSSNFVDTKLQGAQRWLSNPELELTATFVNSLYHLGQASGFNSSFRDPLKFLPDFECSTAIENEASSISTAYHQTFGEHPKTLIFGDSSSNDLSSIGDLKATRLELSDDNHQVIANELNELLGIRDIS